MNKMTGDPNPTQENRPSVFDFDAYPSYTANPIDWSRVPIAPMGSDTSRITTSGQFNYALNYQEVQANLGNFSFCTTQTPLPAQFPFPLNKSTANYKELVIKSNQSIRCKRKTDSPPIRTLKQHITEEKMAEHMSRLHISSETASSSKEPESMRNQRLYMCEEMRKLQTDSILPQSLLSKLQRPCTALVLWTPPRRLLRIENNEENQNNEITVHSDKDINNMDFDNV